MQERLNERIAGYEAADDKVAYEDSTYFTII